MHFERLQCTNLPDFPGSFQASANRVLVLSDPLKKFGPFEGPHCTNLLDPRCPFTAFRNRAFVRDQSGNKNSKPSSYNSAPTQQKNEDAVSPHREAATRTPRNDNTTGLNRFTINSPTLDAPKKTSNKRNTGVVFRSTTTTYGDFELLEFRDRLNGTKSTKSHAKKNPPKQRQQ